jgi:hypothetical protein
MFGCSWINPGLNPESLMPRPSVARGLLTREDRESMRRAAVHELFDVIHRFAARRLTETSHAT